MAAGVPSGPELADDVHLLLGMNAHINYDLPQATLAVITDQRFPGCRCSIERRRRDHERIDMILASRVTAEDQAIGGARSVLDRLLTPANRLSSRRLLREARQKVWLNVAELQRARLDGADAITPGWIAEAAKMLCGRPRCRRPVLPARATSCRAVRDWLGCGGCDAAAAR